jgi:hypothetical protein
MRHTAPSLSLLPVLAGLFAAGLTAGCRDLVAPQSTAWEGDLQPIGPEQIRGSVAIISRSGRSETSIHVEQAEAGATYNWRVRSGFCQVPGDVIGGEAVYAALVANSTGIAEGSAVLSRELDAGGAYAAWLSQATGVEDVLVACGEILRLR